MAGIFLEQARSVLLAGLVLLGEKANNLNRALEPLDNLNRRLREREVLGGRKIPSLVIAIGQNIDEHQDGDQRDRHNGGIGAEAYLPATCCPPGALKKILPEAHQRYLRVSSTRVAINSAPMVKLR